MTSWAASSGFSKTEAAHQANAPDFGLQGYCHRTPLAGLPARLGLRSILSCRTPCPWVELLTNAVSVEFARISLNNSGRFSSPALCFGSRQLF